GSITSASGKTLTLSGYTTLSGVTLGNGSYPILNINVSGGSTLNWPTGNLTLGNGSTLTLGDGNGGGTLDFTGIGQSLLGPGTVFFGNTSGISSIELYDGFISLTLGAGLTINGAG